ncbi:hypothetical protein ACOMHN_005876 [Nucella lapillus]
MLPADSEIQERQTTVDIIQKAASFLESLKQKRTDLIKQKGEPQSFQQMEEMGSKLTALESEVGQMRTAIRDHGKKQETACSLWDRGHKRKTSPLCPVQANSAPDENNSRATSKYSSRRRTTVALLLENKKQSLQDQQQQMLHQQQPQQQVAFPNPTMADLEGANIIERAWLSAELSCQVTSQNTGPQTGDSTITAPIPSTQTFLMGREVPTLVPVGSSPSMNNSRMLPPVPAAAQPYPVTHVLSNGQIWSVAGFMPGSLTPPTLQVLTPTASPSFETQPILTTLTGQGISVLPDQVRRCLQSQLPHQASTVASTLTSAVSTVPRPLPPNLNAPGASSIVKSVQTLALSSSIVSTLRNKESSGLHTEEFSGLSTEEFSRLSTEEFSSLHTEEFSSLPTEEFSGLSTEEFSGLHTEEFSGLHTEEFSDLSTEEFSGLSTEKFSGLSTEEESSGLPTEEFSSLSTEEFSGLSTEESSGLHTEEFSSLSTEEFSGLSTEESSGLHTEEFSSLYTEESSGLHTEEFSGLSTEEFSGLSTEEFSGLHTEEFSGLSTEEFSGLHTEEFSGLSTEEFSGLYQLCCCQ